MTKARVVPAFVAVVSLSGCPGAGGAFAGLGGGGNGPQPGVGGVSSATPGNPAPSSPPTSGPPASGPPSATRPTSGPPSSDPPTSSQPASGQGASASGDGSPAPATPPNTTTLAGPARFTTLGTTPQGRTLFLTLPQVATIEVAIQQTADELAKVLESKPAVAGAFADSRNRTRGGAVFTGRLEGRDVRGWIFCGVDKGAGKSTASVIVAAPDASREQVAALIAMAPQAVPLKTHDFPDGSGSVDLPDGWSTPQNSATWGIVVRGPEGQSVGIANTVLVQTPDGTIARQAQQLYQMRLNNYKMQLRNYQQQLAQHQRYPNIPAPLNPPQEPPPPDLERDMPNLAFCKVCSGAEEVLRDFYPVAERRAKRAGGPYTSLEKVLEVVPADPNPLIAGSKAGVATIAVTDHDGDKATLMRVLVRIETQPVLDGRDSWLIRFNTLRAPEPIFERDLPRLYEILQSSRLNMQVVNKQIQDAGEATRRMGEENQRLLLKRGREFNEQQARQFTRFEARMAAEQQARHDASSDFIEYVGGIRHVYDSATGRMHDVDLFHSDAIVGALNDAANDPGRFIQIPLRYER